MRGDIVYRVYGVHEGRKDDVCFGTYRTIPEAEAEISKLQVREMNGKNWANQYHNKGFVIRNVIVESDFEIPDLPKPREKYFVQVASKPNKPGTWNSTIVDVFRRGTNNNIKICSYERNYSMLQTFEPFRQQGREFALISRDYTKTAVLDLSTGDVIAEESEEHYSDGVPGAGFCPVGFYVPDWFDVYDKSIMPGSEYWGAEYEWPIGHFGFVWGCYWGDDSSWKIQYLDLSRIKGGIIKRDDRFGYVELATRGYRSPCLEPNILDQERPTKPPFISILDGPPNPTVEFAVEIQFDMNTGKSNNWKYKSFSDDENLEDQQSQKS